MDTTNHLENQPRDKLLGELKKAGKDYEDAHFHNLLLLKKYGPNLFEDDGTIVTFCNGKEYRRPGRTFILNTIMHFESKYEPAWYKACAKLKRVLDCYDEKFVIKSHRNIPETF